MEMVETNTGYLSKLKVSPIRYLFIILEKQNLLEAALIKQTINGWTKHYQWLDKEIFQILSEIVIE